MSREGAPRRRGRRAAGCYVWPVTMTLAGRGRRSPSAASSMVVWPYRSEMSSSDQLKGTSGSGRKGETVFCVLSFLCGHQLSWRDRLRLQKKWGWGRSVQQALPGSPESQRLSFRDTAAYAGPVRGALLRGGSAVSGDGWTWPHPLPCPQPVQTGPVPCPWLPTVFTVRPRERASPLVSGSALDGSLRGWLGRGQDLRYAMCLVGDRYSTSNDFPCLTSYKAKKFSYKERASLQV